MLLFIKFPWTVQVIFVINYMFNLKLPLILCSRWSIIFISCSLSFHGYPSHLCTNGKVDTGKLQGKHNQDGCSWWVCKAGIKIRDSGMPHIHSNIQRSQRSTLPLLKKIRPQSLLLRRSCPIHSQCREWPPQKLPLFWEGGKHRKKASVHLENAYDHHICYKQWSKVSGRENAGVPESCHWATGALVSFLLFARRKANDNCCSRDNRDH